MVKVNVIENLMYFMYSMGGCIMSLGFCNSGLRLLLLGGKFGSRWVNGLEVNRRKELKFIVIRFIIFNIWVIIIRGRWLFYMVIVLVYLVNINVYNKSEFLWLF